MDFRVKRLVLEFLVPAPQEQQVDQALSLDRYLFPDRMLPAARSVKSGLRTIEAFLFF